MRGFAGRYERARSCNSTGIESDCDDGEIQILEFFVQGLPPGQVKGASSPRGPREQENFLAAIIGEAMHVAFEIGQFEIRRLQGLKGVASLGGLGAEVPYAMGRVGCPRSAQLFRERGEIEIS